MSNSVKLNAVFKTLMSIVNIVFPLITAPYIARIISIDGFTEFNKAQSMISWFSPFAVFGVYTYGMRSISQIRSDKRKVSELFTTLFIISIFTSLFVTFIFIVLVFLLPGLSAYKLLYLAFSLQLLFICFATDWANEAFESYGFILVKTFFCRVLYVVAVFLFVKKENDILIYVILTSLSLMINNLLTFFYAKRRIPFAKVHLKNITTLIKPLFIVFLLVNSSMLYTVFDRFVLSFFGNKIHLTHYNMSQTLILAIVNVTSSILLVSIPRLSFYWAQNDKDNYYRLLKSSSSIFMALHTPCCFGISCLAYEIMYLYGGTNYSAGYIVLSLFAIRYYVSAFDMVLSKQVLLATGNERHLTRIYYIGGLYNILCKIILVLLNILSPITCLLTTLSADFLVIILQWNKIKHLDIKVKIVSRRLFIYLITCLCFFPIAYFIKFLIIDVGLKGILFRTLSTIIVCSVLYLIVLVVTRDELVGVVLKKMRKNNE